jgi:hypothetical protein
MSGMRATSPMKSDLARQIRGTAGKVDDSHPEMAAAGQHLRKAATLVQSGMHDGAKRHLDAAMELMTPRNLIRHGITDDEGHATAKMAMHQINVHRLGVMDVQDTEARNAQQASAKRDSIAQQAQARAAKLQAATVARQQAATSQAAAKQAAIEQKTAAKPTGTGPGSQQQTGAAPDPILATAVPTRGGLLLSAQTAVLERTPHPNGRPGGPGLYGKAGNKHSDYFEQIVHALMTKRGMTQAQASAIAWSRLRKWSAGGGKVHPEVRAAAGKALGQEQAAKLSWETIDHLIELACPVELAGFNPAEPRVPAGQAGGGQFGGQGGGQGQPGGKGTRAQRRARLVKQAVTLRGEITALLAQIHGAAHHGKSKSSTPAKKGAAATSAKQAAQSKAAASKTPAKAGTKAAAKTMTLAQMRTRLAALRAQLHTVTSEIHQLANEDQAAIELARGWGDAWRHEARGPHGQFVSSGGGPRTPAGMTAARRRAARSAMVRRGSAGRAPTFRPQPHSLRATTGAPASAQAAGGVAPAPGSPLHPEVEHRVRQIAQELDTGVQQAASKDAAAKAAAAARQARQALTDFQAKADAETKHDARLKFATEAGVAVAGAVVTWIETKTGAPDIALILSGPAVLFVQLIIEWIKKL